MTAACVSTNYLLIGVVNVKFMDLIVFISGFIFGPLIGASVGILTWLIYGTLNPYGFSLPILLATCIGESIYGIVGGLLGSRRVLNKYKTENYAHWFINLKFAIAGFLLTFVYDVFTNIVCGIVIGIPIPLVLISGIPFALAHEISNAAFFFVGVTPLIRAIGHFSP